MCSQTIKFFPSIQPCAMEKLETMWSWCKHPSVSMVILAGERLCREDRGSHFFLRTASRPHCAWLAWYETYQVRRVCSLCLGTQTFQSSSFFYSMFKNADTKLLQNELRQNKHQLVQSESSVSTGIPIGFSDPEQSAAQWISGKHFILHPDLCIYLFFAWCFWQRLNRDRTSALIASKTGFNDHQNIMLKESSRLDWWESTSNQLKICQRFPKAL